MSFEHSAFLILAAITWVLWQATRRRENVAVAVLLIASLTFYGFKNWGLLPILLTYSVLNWAVALQLSTSRFAKGWLTLGVGFNLIVLAYYKYTPLLLQSFWPAFPSSAFEHWSIPYGISFYAFTGIAYMVDVYRRDTPAERSLIRYTLSAAFFPHLVAGPILRPSEFLDRVRPGRLPLRPEALNEAAWLLARGFFKKLVVADRIGAVIDPFFEYIDSPVTDGFWSLPYVWLYAVQIYLDFSAYTDLARGFGLLFGYRWPDNFNRPYLSASISEFWRCWHMTLSRFLRDYLYIPLGGNRGPRWRTDLNLMITMLLGGLWHGASWSFVIWGGLHGTFLILHKTWTGMSLRARLITTRWWKWIAVLLTFHAVCLAWCFFRLTQWNQSLTCVRKVFDCHADRMFIGPWMDASVWLAIAIYAVISGLHDRITSASPSNRIVIAGWKRPSTFAFGFRAGIVTGLLILAVLLAPPHVKSPFIYFQF